jgi:hypothetical protein
MGKGEYARANGRISKAGKLPGIVGHRVAIDEDHVVTRQCPHCGAEGLLEIKRVSRVSPLENELQPGVEGTATQVTGYMCLGCVLTSGMQIGCWQEHELKLYTPAEREEYRSRVLAVAQEMQRRYEAVVAEQEEQEAGDALEMYESESMGG